ncbi:MAG: ABC transporter ATP-binding protein [Fimbriimonas sp.]
MTPAISVRDLQVRYSTPRGGSTEAVRGLSFDVAPGEVVGFLGPNGAGKSSTLKALMGFVEPVAGHADVQGHPGGSLAAKGQVGYLPEIANYYPFLTPLETLELYGELQGLSGRALRHEAKELLVALKLEPAMKRLNRTLSKGMLQRVGIAQALLGNPKVLILDEVTSGLDPVARQELRELLKERQRRGATLFFSSHELGEVEMLCDRILVINQGRLVEERKLDGLKEELRRYVLVYEGQVPMLGLTEDWRAGREPNVFVAKFDRKEALLSALQRVAAHNAEIRDIVAQEGSLENYFIDTIRRAA